MKTQLILASASDRRRKILTDLGVLFSVVIPDVDELIHINNPRETVVDNSLKKNLWCRNRFPDAFVLSADTIVEFNNRILTKPESQEQAFEFLRMLSGRMHRVFTGIAFSRPAAPVRTIVDISCVTFRQLSNSMIRNYIDRVNPVDRAGAYDIDENGDLLVESFSGSRTNIMGLPSEAVSELLRQEGLL